MEAAAAQLEAARRAREAEARDNAIQEVEMVLQTYFHNLDNTYNKLAAINENMDDVEVSSSLRGSSFALYYPGFAGQHSQNVSARTP